MHTRLPLALRAGLVVAAGLVLAAAPVRAADGEPEGDGKAPAPIVPDETPQAREKRLRLELDARREELPDSARRAMELVDAFRDRDFRVWSTLRRDVVAQGKDAFPALLIGLEELDWEVRAFAASCLALVGDRSVAAALGDAYDAEQRFAEARRQCVMALAEIRAESSRDLFERAVKEEDPGIRIAAVRGLGRLASDEVVPTLRGVADDADLDVRYEALGALVERGDPESLATLIAEAEALVVDRKAQRTDSAEALDNGERYSHYLLGLALARANDKKADKIVVTALLAGKPYDHKSFLRMGAAEGLGRRAAAGGELHPKLVSGISHKKDEVRIACSYGAGWAGNAELVPKLVTALGDSQLDVKHNAVMALGRIGDPKSVKGLRRAVKDKRGEVRIGAVRALSEIHTAEATAGLITALGDEKYMVRVMAVQALAKRTAEKGVLPAILRLAKDRDYGVREAVVAALAHHPVGEEVFAALSAALEDRDYGVRTNACLGLAKIARNAPVAAEEGIALLAVREYLGAKEKKLVRGAEEFLDAVRPPAAVEPLIAALGDDNEETRRRANLALKKMSETTRNFKEDGPANDRIAAQKRWREWWAEADGKLPARGSRPRAAITGLAETARDLKWRGLDIALLFDSTGSMAGLIRAAKERVDEIIHELHDLLPSLRVSVYTYRDFGDSYVYWGSPLTYDTWKLSGFLQNATHGQGGDIPEAVYDTTKNVMENLKWRPEAHKVIVYAGDAPHHPEQHADFIRTIKKFCTPKNLATLHAVFTDTNRRSLDIKARKKRFDMSSMRAPFFEVYTATATAGRGRAVMLDDESALIKELLVLTFGEAWRADVENLLDFEY